MAQDDYFDWSNFKNDDGPNSTMRATDLSELAAFDAGARHRSFTRAAKEREVTASAISHAVSSLENRLGVRLLNRTTRKCVAHRRGRDASREPGSSLRCDSVRSRWRQSISRHALRQGTPERARQHRAVRPRQGLGPLISSAHPRRPVDAGIHASGLRSGAQAAIDLGLASGLPIPLQIVSRLAQ